MMTKDQLMTIARQGSNTYLGSCQCGYDLVISKQDQTIGPADEIMLECEIMETGECVKEEWFKIAEITD